MPEDELEEEKDMEPGADDLEGEDLDDDVVGDLDLVDEDGESDDEDDSEKEAEY